MKEFFCIFLFPLIFLLVGFQQEEDYSTPPNSSADTIASTEFSSANNASKPAFPLEIEYISKDELPEERLILSKDGESITLQYTNWIEGIPNTYFISTITVPVHVYETMQDILYPVDNGKIGLRDVALYEENHSFLKRVESLSRNEEYELAEIISINGYECLKSVVSNEAIRQSGQWKDAPCVGGWHIIFYDLKYENTVITFLFYLDDVDPAACIPPEIYEEQERIIGTWEAERVVEVESD